jgi:lysyl-tRNA synthetase class 2
VYPRSKNSAGDERERLANLRLNIRRRALILNLTRKHFGTQGFTEVETPVRAPRVAPEPNITPYESEGWFLSTSPELHMKRLLAAGYDKIFQFSRCFRQAERGRWHNPEFTLLEWYRLNTNYLQVLHDTERLFIEIAAGLGLGSVIKYQGLNINLAEPWPQITVQEAFQQYAGWDPVTQPDPNRFDLDLINKVIPQFSTERPTMLLDYPAPMAALARLKPENPLVAERAEVFIGGLEIANAYSELTDPDEQAQRFRQDIELIYKERGARLNLPEKFLEATHYLPPCSGIALGIDRMIMLFCDAAAIDEVIAFTQETA